jgi:hypothetical protein
VGPLVALSTVAHLKPSQVSNRVWRRFRPVPRDWPEAAGYRLVARGAVPAAPGASTRVQGDTFKFLGQRHRLETADRWSPSALPRLWAYQLHYFRWLGEAPVERGLEFLRDWVSAQTPGASPGWEPFPLSIRIREWLEWLLAHPDVPADNRRQLVASLAHQTRALEIQLEYHLAGNHLLENAITLCWAGLTLEGPSSARWLRAGLDLLEAELAVQVLDDGTHDERSPMYQGLLAEALLRLARVAGAVVRPEAERVCHLADRAGAQMGVSLQELIHPDGEIALLNDSALGEGPAVDRLMSLAPSGATGPGPDGPWDLPAAGYAGYRAPGHYLVFDAGPIGPDHQPGHGHADTLSFELSHRRQRLVTDTGVHTYEPGPVRTWDRGTAAHNTLQFDGRDQSELWASFRCGRRARVIGRRVEKREGGVLLLGEYRGPGRGLRSVRHRRAMMARPSGIEVSDQAQAPGDHEGLLRLHLAPGVAVQARQGGWEIRRDGVAVARLSGVGFEWRETRSPYNPSFGVEQERVCLEAPLTFRDQVSLSWLLRLL